MHGVLGRAPSGSGSGRYLSFRRFSFFCLQKNTCKTLANAPPDVYDKKIRNTDIYFNQFQYNYNIEFLLLPPLTRSPSLKDGGFCTPKLSQINKNLQVLNRADNIRPYRASKDIAKNSKHLQALNRVEQSPPLQKNKHRKGREWTPCLSSSILTFHYNNIRIYDFQIFQHSFIINR